MEDRFTIPALIGGLAFRAKMGPLEGCTVELGSEAYKEAMQEWYRFRLAPNGLDRPNRIMGLPLRVLDSGADKWRVQVVG